MRILVFVCCCLLSCVTAADVYKWIDENGKVRFGDKPPKDTQSENIEKTLKVTNVDSAISQAGSSSVAASEKNDDEKALEQKKRENLDKAIGKRCRDLKADIDSIARGDRGIFIGKDGKEEVVLERDRAKKLDEWRAQYRKSDCQKIYPLE